MVKINQRIDATINLGNYENVKIGLEINDVDTDEDVDAQIADAQAAFKKVWPEMIKVLLAEKDSATKNIKA